MSWRIMHGIKVYEEDGVIKRAIKNGVTAFPYVKDKRGWENVGGCLTYKQLSERIRRGTAKIV